MPRSGRSARLIPVLVGLAFTLPALTVGFAFDDLIQRLSLEGGFPLLPPSNTGLYDFTRGGHSMQELIDASAFPWFTYPHLSLRFFRPLASASLALDHVLFGRNALLAHLQSLAWLGVLVGFATALYTRWLEPRVARLASLLYAIAGVHAIPTAWLASRHTLVAATFSLIALWAWARWREDRWRPGAVLTAVALALSLLSSEAWLAGLALLILYELGTRAAWRERARGAAPFAVAGVLYAVLYDALGYGIRGSAMYVSPLDAPGPYLTLALTRVPQAFAELFGGAPSILAGADPSLAGLLVAWGLATALLCTGVVVALRARLGPDERTPLVWLGLGALLTPFLLVGTAMTGRVLPVPLLGAAALVAQSLVLAWRAVRRDSSPRRWFAAIPLLVLGATHLVLSPLGRLGIPLVFGAAAASHERVAREADLGPCAHGGRVYLLTGSDPGLALYLAPSLLYYTPEKMGVERLRVLAMAPHDLAFTRLDDHSFELEVIGRPRRANDFERLYRPGFAPLEPGQAVVVEEMRAQVLETSEGYPTRVRFELDESLDSPAVCFVAWQEQGVRLVPAPAPGRSVTIAHEIGPTGL